MYNYEPPATKEEIESAALQYVRKVSGFQKPSRVNSEAFETAVKEVARATASLVTSLSTAAPPRNREIEAARAKERNRVRFGG